MEVVGEILQLAGSEVGFLAGWGWGIAAGYALQPVPLAPLPAGCKCPHRSHRMLYHLTSLSSPATPAVGC